MLIKLKSHIGGFRNGVEWPPAGTIIEIPDHEAADLIAATYAEEAPADATVEYVAPVIFADPDGGPVYQSAQAPADEPIDDGEPAGTTEEGDAGNGEPAGEVSDDGESADDGGDAAPAKSRRGSKNR